MKSFVILSNLSMNIFLWTPAVWLSAPGDNYLQTHDINASNVSAKLNVQTILTISIDTMDVTRVPSLISMTCVTWWKSLIRLTLWLRGERIFSCVVTTGYLSGLTTVWHNSSNKEKAGGPPPVYSGLSGQSGFDVSTRFTSTLYFFHSASCTFSSSVAIPGSTASWLFCEKF